MNTITQLLWLAGPLLLLYMTAWYAFARSTRRLDVVDTAWGGSFIVIALTAFAVHPSTATLVMALIVAIWGGRLMRHTWQRHRKHEQDDPRYTRLSAGWHRAFWLQVYAKVFLFQGVLAAIIALPIIMNVQVSGRTPLAVLGVIIWAVGFYFESTADHQLRDFLARAKHKKVLDEGLWRYSRHPNYFGESLQWWGIAVVALAAPWGWVGLIGPAVLTTLLVFVSGIPTVERGKDKDPDYRSYQRRTSPFIPLPPRDK